MPDTSVTLPGRCLTCGQSLVLPTEHIVSEFACPRCGAKSRGTALLDHSSKTANLGTAEPASLQRFEEESDEVTRMHNPDAIAETSAARSSAVPAQLLKAAPSRPVALSAKLSRFSEDTEDPTKLHMPMSFEDDAISSPNASSSLGSSPYGSSPATASSPQAAGLVAFKEEEDPEQQTRIEVPLSYEDEPKAVSAPPLSKPPLASRALSAPPLSGPPLSGREVSTSVLPPAGPTPPVSIPPQNPISLPGPYDGSAPPPGRRGFVDGFGQDMLQLSMQIDAWLSRRRTVIMAGTAIAAGIAAPLADTIFASQHEVATVLTSNMMLFVLWLFAFSWTGRRRNDNGHWDSAVIFERLRTHHKLVWTELALFERLPLASKFQTVSELLMPVGILALVVASTISISRTVWGWPETTAGLFFLRFSGSAVVLFALLARHQAQTRQGSSHGPGLDASASATKQFPAIVDLERPLPSSPDQTNTFVREVVQALSLWQATDWPNLDSYRLAMQRHLMARMPWATMGVQPRAPGTRREDAPDLVINGTVLVRLRRGFDNSVPLAATAQMQAQAKGWGIKPTLLVLFDTPMSVLEGASATALQGLHRTHPILILRMPMASSF